MTKVKDISNACIVKKRKREEDELIDDIGGKREKRDP
jgi:hypothetical protein